MSRTRRRPRVMLARWACHPHLLLQLPRATRAPLLWASSFRRSSCAAAAASGSAAPSPPAAPPAPPSTMTRPPPGGARPRCACSPPPAPPPTDGREARRGRVETSGVCRGFWAATTRRIQKDLGSSSDSSMATPCCSPEEGSRSRCLVVNQNL